MTFEAQELRNREAAPKNIKQLGEECRDLLLRFRELGAVKLSPSAAEQEEMEDLLDKLEAFPSFGPAQEPKK